MCVCVCVRARARGTGVVKDQLPTKTDRVVFIPLSALQLRVYQRVIASRDAQLVIRAKEPCDCGSARPYNDALRQPIRNLYKHLRAVRPSGHTMTRFDS